MGLRLRLSYKPVYSAREGLIIASVYISVSKKRQVIPRDFFFASHRELLIFFYKSPGGKERKGSESSSITWKYLISKSLRDNNFIIPRRKKKLLHEVDIKAIRLLPLV